MKQLLLFFILLFSTTQLISQTRTRTNYNSYSIPDGYSSAYSSVTFSGIPAGSLITRVDYETSVYHAYHNDLRARISTNYNGTSSPSKLLYNEGTQGTGSGYLDKDGSTFFFNNLDPNQTFYLRVWDTSSYDTGDIDYFRIKVYYTTPNPSVTSVSPTSAILGQSVTFHVYGSNLTNSTAYHVPDFGDGNVNSSSSTTHKTFTETSSYNTGIKHCIIKDQTGGNVLKYFDVNVYFPTPTSLTATANSTSQIYINWNNVSGRNHYKLYRSTSAYGTYTEIYNGATSQYYDNTLSPNTTYYYKVQACQNTNQNSCSSQSNYVSATTNSNPTVTSVSPTSAILGESVTFHVYGSNLTNSTAYHVPDFGDGNVTPSSSTTQKTFTETSSYNTGIKHCVIKDQTGGNVLKYFDVNVYFPTPINLTATSGGSSQINLTWNSVSNSNHYKIYRSTSSGGTYIQKYSGSNTNYIDTGLNPNTTYYYKVQACQNTNQNSCSSQSNYVSATTGIPTPTVNLIQPNNGVFTVGDNMYIDWSSTNQHHWEIDILENGVQIGKELSSPYSTITNYTWQIPSTTIDDNGVTHTLNGNNYQIKIVVWNSGETGAGIAYDISTGYLTINANTCTYNDTDTLSTEELNAVTFLCEEELLQDNTFNDTVEPNNPINRAELSKLAYLSIDLQDNSVADVYPSPSMDLQDETLWYYSYAKNLIYLEYGDGIAPFNNDSFFFYPAKPITKANALKVLLETWNITILDGTNYNYTDISTNSIYYDYKYIYTAYQKGIISDTGDNLFHPNDEVLRKDIFVWLYRMMNNASISIPTPTESDFFLAGNYTPYTFVNYNKAHSGNFNFYTESSFNISGIGIPLDFAFTYNSYATEITSDLYPVKPMGFGWSHTYNSYIVEKVKEYTGSDNDRNAIIHFPTGEFNVYNHLGSNQYEPITIGIYDELEKLNGSTYRLTTKNKMVYIYEKFTGTPPSFPYVLTSITDRNDNTLTLQYDLAESSSGYKRLIKVIDTSGRELNFTYYAGSDLIKSVSDPISRSITFDYDSYHFSYLDQPNLVSYQNPRAKETTYNYGTIESERHLLKTITLPENNTVTNTYQNKKLLSSKTNGNQPTTYNISPNYGQTGNDNFIETIITNPNTNETITLRYNRDGSVQYLDKDNITTSTIIYDSTQKNLPISVTTNGRTTTMTYDSLGNVEVINRPLSVSHHYTYTDYNDVATYTDPESNTYYYNYIDGNIDNIVTPRGTTNFGVNPQGLITSITNPFGIQTTFSHDPYGNVNGTSTESISTSATYDNASRLQTFTNPNGETIVYQLDANDNLERETFNNRITRYEFDDNDNLDKIINAKNRPTTLNYDNEDLLRSVIFEGTTDAYTYLVDGKIDTYTNPKLNVFTYNYESNNGRLQAITSGSDFINYAYETNTNNIKTVTNNNGAINYTFDILNRVKSTTDYYGNTVGYDYNLNSNITKITYPDGKEVDYTYYSDNLLHTVKDWNNNETVYTYRVDGLLLTTTYPNGTYETISYDSVGRPNGFSWKKADGTVINEYTFISDSNGNHITETKTEQLVPTVLPDENITYTHNNLNRLLTAGSDNFSYDANGNTITGSGNTYTWDKYDRLTNVTGNFNASYEYDGNGNRRKSTVNGTTKKFVLDVLGLSKVLVETDNSNNGQKYYVYGLGLISRTDNSNNTRYFHYDYRGSTIAMTDENENITHKYSYSDFGEVLQADEEDFNQFRYVGKYGIQYETENLAFMRARYYNPVVGRFLTEDPIWSTNLYPYAGNNPVNNVDVNGEFVITATVLFGGFIMATGIYGSWKVSSAIVDNAKSLKYQADSDYEKSAYYDRKAQEEFVDGMNVSSVGATLGSIGLPYGNVNSSSPKPSPNFRTPTNAPQSPLKNVPNGMKIRIMKPTKQYPNGYWRLEKTMSQGGAQGINPSTMKPGLQHETHIPLPKGYLHN